MGYFPMSYLGMNKCSQRNQKAYKHQMRRNKASQIAPNQRYTRGEDAVSSKPGGQQCLRDLAQARDKQKVSGSCMEIN